MQWNEIPRFQNLSLSWVLSCNRRCKCSTSKQSVPTNNMTMLVIFHEIPLNQRVIRSMIVIRCRSTFTTGCWWWWWWYEYFVYIKCTWKFLFPGYLISHLGYLRLVCLGIYSLSQRPLWLKSIWTTKVWLHTLVVVVHLHLGSWYRCCS